MIASTTISWKVQAAKVVGVTLVRKTHIVKSR